MVGRPIALQVVSLLEGAEVEADPWAKDDHGQGPEEVGVARGSLAEGAEGAGERVFEEEAGDLFRSKSSCSDLREPMDQNHAHESRRLGVGIRSLYREPFLMSLILEE